jgi:hypothetical protein
MSDKNLVPDSNIECRDVTLTPIICGCFVASRLESSQLADNDGARCRVRTCDTCRVKAVLYH